ncbi:MAG: TonB-dependent receptor [Bacteroidaceae bacterium]|nr:TonB-dependent receptor [Bacteroidaceae bacterium]
MNEAITVASKRDAAYTASAPSFRLDTAALRRTAATDLATALRHVAGINVRDYGGAGGLKTISVRGIGAAHTTVCYDGLPMANTQSGAVDVGAFAFEQIAALRLDIGDTSPLLTPVRTLSAATLFIQTHNKSASSLKTELKTGSWELINPSVTFNKSIMSKFHVGGHARFYFRNNNYKFRIDNGALSTTERRNNSRTKSGTAELWFNTQLSSNQKWMTKVYYSLSNNKLPGAVVLYNYENHEVMKDALWFAQSKYEGRWGKTHTSAAVKYQGQLTRYDDDNSQYPKEALRQKYNQQEFYTTIGAEHQLAQRWSVAYAADYFYNTLSSYLSDADGASRHTLQHAFSVRYKPRRLSVTARAIAHHVWNKAPKARQKAARNMSKWQTSLAAAYIFEPFGVTTRLFYKDYYRQPTFSENYFYHLGTTDLKPERTQQFGVGAAWLKNTSWGGVRLSVDGYYNDITDRITSVPYNLFIWRTENRGKVSIAGIDLNTNIAFKANNDHEFCLAMNYSLQEGQDKTDNSDLTYKKQPPYLPRHSGAASFSWENPWVNLNIGISAASHRWATAQHAVQTKLPGYAEVNFSVARAFNVSKFKLTTALHVNNALDKSYEIVRRYPMPLRNFMFTIKLSSVNEHYLEYR